MGSSEKSGKNHLAGDLLSPFPSHTNSNTLTYTYNYYVDPISVAMMAEEGGERKDGWNRRVEKPHLWEGEDAEVLISVCVYVWGSTCLPVSRVFILCPQQKRKGLDNFYVSLLPVML